MGKRLIVCAALLLSGCSGETHGRLTCTLNGQPSFDSGDVEYVSVDGRSGTYWLGHSLYTPKPGEVCLDSNWMD